MRNRTSYLRIPHSDALPLRIYEERGLLRISYDKIKFTETDYISLLVLKHSLLQITSGPSLLAKSVRRVKKIQRKKKLMLARCAELWECGAQKSQSSHGALKGETARKLRLHVQGTGKGRGKSGISPILITSKKEKIRVQFRIQRERGRNDEMTKKIQIH